MSGVEHSTTCTDEMVNLVSGGQTMGTVARCTCGWRSSWWVMDGSAEADASGHMYARDPEYRAEADERARLWEADAPARAAKAEADLMKRLARTPLGPECKPRPPRERCHGCSCHLHPPCGACENCNHYDNPDCDNDCQDCDIDHDS